MSQRNPRQNIGRKPLPKTDVTTGLYAGKPGRECSVCGTFHDLKVIQRTYTSQANAKTYYSAYCRDCRSAYHKRLREVAHLGKPPPPPPG